MKMLMKVTIPHEKFNAAVKDGNVAGTLGQIMEETKPESVYSTSKNGKRGVVMVVNVEKNSDLPKFAEPWFFKFNADCEFDLMMTPQDLQESGLDEIGKKWTT